MQNLMPEEREIVLRRVNIRFNSSELGLVNEVKISIKRVVGGEDSMRRPAVAGFIITAEWTMLHNSNAAIYAATQSMAGDSFGTLHLSTEDGANSLRLADVLPVYDFVLDGNGKFSGLTALAQRSATASEVYDFLVNANFIAAETNAITYSTNQAGYSPIGYYMRPKSVYYEGIYHRTYFTWQESPSADFGNSQNNWVVYYDHDTQTFGTATAVGPDKPGTDNHHTACIEVTDDGFIVVAYDQLVASGGDHNGGVRVLRSNNPEDITAFTQITVIEAGGQVLKGAYPHLVKRHNNELWVVFRWLDSGMNVYHIWMAKSLDAGLTWGDGYPIVQISADTHDWAYNTHAPGKRSNDVRIAVNVTNHTTSKTYKLLVLRSRDGITWGNEQQTFTKDVVANGQITPAESDANLIMDEVADDGVVYTFFRGSGVSPENVFYALVSTDLSSGPLMYLFMLENGAWVKRQITGPAAGWFSGELVVYDINTIDLIARTVDKFTMEHWRSRDRGLSWEYIGNIIYQNPNILSYELVNCGYNDQGKLVYLVEDRHATYHDLVLRIYNMGE